MKNLFIFLLITLFISSSLNAVDFVDPQVGWGPSSANKDGILIEDFEDAGRWETWKPGKETISLENVPGKFKNALKINYDIPVGGQFVIFKKPINIDLTKKGKITFWIRAQGNPNGFEFKIIDKDGSTFIRRFFSGAKSSDWHIEQFDLMQLAYGWGGENRTLEPPLTIELAISRGYGTINGGKGWIELDELRLIDSTPHIELSINQIGFTPASDKKAVVCLVNNDNEITNIPEYEVISLKDDKVKYKGKAEIYGPHIWAGQFWNINFSKFKKKGQYKLKVSLNIDNETMELESYPFQIKKNILVNELSHSQFHYIRSTRYPTNIKHIDPVPGGYLDTEFDIEKWMTTTPTWVWAMARWARLLPKKIKNKNFDPIDEIKFAAEFCIKMQDKKTGGVYIGINKTFKGIWPSDITAEEDTHDLILTKKHGVDINTAYVIAMTEVYKVLKKRKPKLAKNSLKASKLAWTWLDKKSLTTSPNIGMFIWASMRLYEVTKKKKYLKKAKEYAKKLLPLQFLDYKNSDQGVIGKFFRNSTRKDFNHQYKFVHAMGIQMGLIELAAKLSKKNSLRKKIMKHLDYYAYGYLKKTSELNPYGVIAQSLEPDEKTKKINYNFFASPKSVIGIHGLNCDIMAMGIISLRYARLTKNRAFAQIAYDQINWVLGKNLSGFCMLSGKGTTNPFMQVSDWNKGPVLGGIPNGFVCPEERNIPKWMADWNSGEYWKPHNAMLLVLMAELESKLLSNPFKLKTSKKHNTKLEEIYKELDKIETNNISK